MLSIFSAWARYFRFSIRTIIIHRRYPGYVANDEDIAREIFSSQCYRADGSLKLNAFSFDRKRARALSVNRVSLAPQTFFDRLALKHARRRNLTYYGSAHLTARKIRGIVMDNSWIAEVVGSAKIENPFHADIPLPPDHGKDYDMAVRAALTKSAIFRRASHAK